MNEYITMRDCLKLDLKDAIAQRDNLTDQRDFAISEMERLEEERDEAREECLEQCKLLAISADREEKLRTALQRLADCDWVISLPDRMDAVRKIAREALQ